MLHFLSFQKVIYFPCVNKMGEESHNDAGFDLKNFRSIVLTNPFNHILVDMVQV